MKRRIALASTLVCSAALIAVAAVPASARVPSGQGLASFGFADCGSLGHVEIVGPPAEPAPSGYLVGPGQPGLHVVATQFQVAFDGEVVATKSFGEKAGLTTITCTQTFEDPDEGTGVFTLTAAIVPPR